MTGSFALVKVSAVRTGLDLNSFAYAAGLHPDLVVRYVELGLLDPRVDSAGRWAFEAADLTAVARIQRLRAGFGLNYAAVGLVLDLLDRLAARDTSLAARDTAREGGPPWTPTS